MYFCTPTFDPYEEFAKTLQAAYPPARTMHVVTQLEQASGDTVSTMTALRDLASAA